MEKLYVFGHKKPDTDSICSAIATAYLINKKSDEYHAEPRALGKVNPETEFVLKYFGFDAPEYLNDVKIRIRNTNYRHGLFIDQYATLKEAYYTMLKERVTTIPVVDEDEKLVGLLTLADVAQIFMDDNYQINTYFDTIVKTLDATVINKADKLVKGDLLIAGYRSTRFVNEVKDLDDKILLLGDRFTIIEHAITSGARMIILTGGAELKEHHLEMIKKYNINCIMTFMDTAETSHAMRMVNFIKQYVKDKLIITLEESDYYADIPEITKKHGYSSYPVLDKDDRVLGLFRLVETMKTDKKKVVLVDHNEKGQSVIGLEEAEIVEVIDHHKLGNIETNKPINFRNMAVGSTCSIVYLMYKDSGIEIPKGIKGLLLSAIMSDTLLLQSPTATKLDKDIVEKLAKDLEIDHMAYAREMFKAGSTIKGLSAEEIIMRDYKRFSVDNLWVGVGQLFVIDLEEIDAIKDEIILEIDKIKKLNDFQSVMLFITSVIDNDSYVYYSSGSEEILERAFDRKDVSQGMVVKGVVSRKKQIIPNLMEAIR